MYKALLLDIDGTLIKYDYKALPTKKVVNAIKEAQKKITVCLVTGRSYGSTQRFLDVFEMHSGFVVVNNGANVVDISTKEIIYDQSLNKRTADAVAKLLRDEDIPFYLKCDAFEQAYDHGHFGDDETFDKAYLFATDEFYSAGKIDRIINLLAKYNDITATRSRHKGVDKFGIHISHVNATKLHGIYAVIKKLNIDTSETIGIGDGYNDFPLLMASGFKVAMGNAIPDLKDVADYIAPSVSEDGVVDIIEKFVLK